MAALSIANLAKEEDRNARGHWQRGGWKFFVREYQMEIGHDLTMPVPGAYFPGESSGARIIHGGVSVRIIEKRDDTEEVRVRIVASSPIYEADTDGGEFTYGTG